MKTIESVSLLPGERCDKMGLAYGDTWWEEEGDIFRTREEAEAYILAKGWTKKQP
jgi:nuclear transport factor 2 (NTF2) superfamily protein